MSAGFAIAPEKCRVLACLESKELSRFAVRTRGLRGFQKKEKNVDKKFLPD